MSFEDLLLSAKNNDYKAKTKVMDMFRPLLIKESIINDSFDEDLYQELQEVALNTIKSFLIKS